MQISPIRNDRQIFKGNLIVNNIKANTVEKIITDKKTDKQLKDGFNHIINSRMFVMKSQEECLSKLKECVNNFSNITGVNLGKNLKYPSKEEISVMYNSAKDISKLDVPGYFSIVHSVK